MKEPTEKQKIGKLGEDIAVKYLENKGYSVIDRNYLKKYGEIDIVAKKRRKVHFIEVKSVSREIIISSRSHRSNLWDKSVSLRPRLRPIREFTNSESANSETDNYRAEDNLHSFKLKRLKRVIQVYLLENYQKEEQEWQFDAVIVEIDVKRRQAKVKFLKDIIL